MSTIRFSIYLCSFKLALFQSFLQGIRGTIIPSVSQKVEITPNNSCLNPSWSSPFKNPTAGHTHQGNQNWKRRMYPNAVLFTIARTWKQPRCPSADEWIRKLWYIYTVEYYSAIKKNAFESVLTRWMKLEPIIQSEVNQRENTNTVH